MMKHLRAVSSFFHRETVELLSLFAIVRFVSFLTYGQPIANQFIAAVLIVGFIYICKKNLALGWMILVLELLLGGSGHLFEFQTLILRTWFLGIFGLFWLFKKIKEKKIDLNVLPRPLMINMTVLAVTIAFAIVNGFLKGNAPMHIVQDAILYFFILLFFPAIELRKYLPTHLPTIIQAFIIGSAIFSVITFIIYASGLGTLPDLYYHWFRNIAAGKITDLGNNFFRIVLPEQLLIVPIILVLASQLIHKHKDKLLWALLTCSLIVLALNFSRIYFLALAVGLLVLAIRNNLKRWFIISTVTGVALIAIFISFNLVASGGKTLGLELVNSRFGAAAAPQTEVSGAIRLAILPEAIALIKKHPLLGSGLGTPITYTDPVTEERVTRTQFDWGYHEMIAELGILGFGVFLSFLFSIVYYLARLAYRSTTIPQELLPLLRGLIAGVASLFVINITTPALFHGFSMLYIITILFLISKYTTQANVSSE